MADDKQTNPAAPEMRQIATTQDGRDITRGYIDFLPYIQPQDRILRLRGSRNYQLYEDVLRDPQVQSVFGQRRRAVVAHMTEVTPGGTMRRDRMAADFITELLAHIKWDTVTNKMLYGRFYGYSVAEVLWVRDGAHVTIDALKVRNRRRFVFDPDFKPKLLTTENPNGEMLPERKFWTLATGADHDDEPYGLGLAHWLYWPVFFKRNQIKFWLIASERFGQPTVVGKYPPSAGADEQDKLHDAVTSIRTDTGVTIPNDTIIELLEKAQSGSMDYAGLHDRLDAAISKVVVGQTMTTDDGSSRSQAEVHLDVRKDIITSDDCLICDSFNDSVVRWVCDWNFPGAAYPKVKRNMEEAPDLKALAERDLMIVKMTGKVPDDKYIEETYNLQLVDKAPLPDDQDDDDDKTGNGGGDGADMAEGDLAPLEQALDAIDAEDWQSLSEPLVKPIIERAKAEPESLMEDLAELYPELDAGALEEQLTRIIFAADIWAQLSVREDA